MAYPVKDYCSLGYEGTDAETISDAELEGFLDDLESDRVERKETFKGDVPQKARQAICAFANDLPGHDEPGVLFIGAKDDGSSSGLSVTDELLLSLADMKTDGNILPLPTLVVEKRHLKGADMAVITVHPSDMPPVRYNGRIWIRTRLRRGLGQCPRRTPFERKAALQDPLLRPSCGGHAVQSPNHFLSTSGREFGILMTVHPFPHSFVG